MDLTTVFPIALKASIALTVLGFALKATPSELLHLARRPNHLARALFSMDVIMPVVAVALALAFDLHPAVKIALVALSVSPMPPLLPKKAFKAGSRESSTISLLATAAVAAIAIVPLAMEVFGRVFDIPLAMAPSAVAAIIFTSVLAPLIGGIALNSLAPNLAKSLARPVSIIGAVLLVAAVIPLLIVLWPAMYSLIGNGTIVAIAAFVAAGLIAGHLLGGPHEEDRRALALSTASRHPAVAIAIAQTNFPEEKLAPAAVLLYLAASAIFVVPYLKWSSIGHTWTRGGHKGIDTSAARPVRPWDGDGESVNPQSSIPNSNPSRRDART